MNPYQPKTGARCSCRQKPLETICAWCHPNVSGPDITHGICEHHKQQMLQDAGIGGDVQRGPDDALVSRYRANPKHPAVQRRGIAAGLDPFERSGLEIGGVRVSVWKYPGAQNFIAFIAANGSSQIDTITLNGGIVERDSLASGIPVAGLRNWKPVTEVPESLHRLIQEHLRKAVH